MIEEEKQVAAGEEGLVWQVVAFTLGDQIFAVNVNKTREIMQWRTIQPLPESHPALLGLATLRGEVIPVVDLGSFLKVESDVPIEEKKLIVTDFEGIKAGFAVDGVRRIYTVSSSQLDSTLTGTFMSENLLYVIKLEDENILMLDFEHILQEVNPSSRKQMEVGRGKALSVLERLGDASRLRVMVAEDSSLMAEMIKEALKEGGFKCLESAPDGKKAMEKLLVAEEEGCPFHLLISDVEMPVMDGLQLLGMVKSEPRLSSMPVVMFSSIMTESMRNKAREAGSQAEISKPDIDTLLETVCGLLAE